MGKTSEAPRYPTRQSDQGGPEEHVSTLSLFATPDARAEEIGALLSIAGYELCAPVAPLKMRLQQTRRRLQREGGSARNVDDIAKALYQVERVQQQVALFLDAAALAYGCFDLVRRWCDLSGAARRLADIYASAGANRAIRLVETGGELTGEWDGARLEMALREMLGNALRFTTGDITLRLVRQGAFAAVMVEDMGPAIPDSLRERVFEPYVTGARGNHGLGLGLFVAREIARLHGGEMGISDSDAGGSAVWLTLPLTAH